MKVLLLVALLTGCDWSLHRMQEQPRCKTDGATTLLPGGACNVVPPPGIVAISEDMPVPALSRSLILRGRNRFEHICAACHGVAGDGDSPVARAMTLRRPPPLIDDAAKRLTDARILTVMQTGYGMMPSYRELLEPADRQAVLVYIRVLQSRDVPFAQLGPAWQQEASRWLH